MECSDRMEWNITLGLFGFPSDYNAVVDVHNEQMLIRLRKGQPLFSKHL